MRSGGRPAPSRQPRRLEEAGCCRGDRWLPSQRLNLVFLPPLRFFVRATWRNVAVILAGREKRRSLSVTPARRGRASVSSSLYLQARLAQAWPSSRSLDFL